MSSKLLSEDKVLEDINSTFWWCQPRRDLEPSSPPEFVSSFAYKILWAILPLWH